VYGDLLEQRVDAIVNAWNRNIIPWWLLIPQGVSGAIKRHGGTGPFREVRRHGPMPLGSAVWTGAGRLPFRGIIHVAGIDLWWRASEASIRGSVRNAVRVAREHHVARLAMPVIGAGSGGFDEVTASRLIEDEARLLETDVDLTLVRYRPGP
jgi:O-acetyl-ADP-ribose deacetylase (regulator of RNase III)